MKARRTLSVLTAAVLAAGMAAVPVYAHTVSDIDGISLNAVKLSPDVVDSGTCGALGWSLNENGELSLYSVWDSSDPIPDFSDSERPSFEKYKSRIKAVYIGESVEKLGSNTFKGCKNLERVAFLNNGSWGYSRLRTIGNGAFEGCTALKKFAVPFTVTAVGDNAFKGCSSLTDLKFGLTCSVGADAFSGCPLSHIDILRGYSSSDFYTENSGLPSDSSLYHKYTASVSPYSSEDIFKEYGDTDENGNVWLRSPSFDRCESAGCVLNTLGPDELKITYTPENIVLRTFTNGMAENEYSNGIDYNASEEFYTVYDPVNGRYLTMNSDYSVFENYSGFVHSKDDMAEAGLEINGKGLCNDYFFDDYHTVVDGRNNVICENMGIYGGSAVEISNDTPAAGEKVSVKIIPASGYTVEKTEVYRNYRYSEEKILSTSDSEFTFTAEGSNATYNVVVKLNNDKVADFVERLYTTLLGRASEAEGKAEWVTDLNNGRAAADAASGFVLSAELKNQNLSNSEFVDRMYRTFLDREADAAGKADWVSILDNGCSYAYILNSFAGSQEFMNLCDSYGIIAGSYESTEPRDKNVNLTAFVSRMYTKALGRAYDVSGLNDWTGDYLDGKKSANDIAYGFILSQEFEGRNLSDEAYVDTLYRTFFDREPDEGGKAGWLDELANGTSRKDVLDGFLGAQECKNLVASFGI